MKEIFKNPYIVGLIVISAFIVTYKLFTLCLGYFDKDGRFVLHGELQCPYMVSPTLMNDGNIFFLTGNTNNKTDKPNYNPACSNIAQIYNTKTGKVKYAGKPLAESGFAQTVLLKNGKILIVGANPKLWVDFPARSTKPLDDKIIKSQYAELYDPETGEFSFAGKMIHPRSGSSMVLLHDGKVLILGGHSYNKPVKQCELFDPSTNKFYIAGNLNIENIESTSILKSGNVLIIGGLDKKIELYDTHLNKSKIIGNLSKQNNTFPLFSTAILLNDGRVLIFSEDFDSNRIIPTLYVPENNTLTELSLYDKKRKAPVYTALLPNGKVLIAGGKHPAIIEGYVPISTAEIFDPNDNSFKPVKNHLQIARSGAKTITLKDGSVLIIGGYTWNDTKKTELFIPKISNN